MLGGSGHGRVRRYWGVRRYWIVGGLAVSLLATTTPVAADELEAVDVLSVTDLGGDGFGFAIAVDRNTAIVGAPGAAPSSEVTGSAHVFVRDPDGRWRDPQTLVAEDGANGDWFGTAVSVDGDTALVGASRDDGSGTAYLFTRDEAGSWVGAQKLAPSDGAAGDSFGSALAVSGTTALVGAPWDDNRGAVYVFERNAHGRWDEAQKLVVGDGGSLGLFGSSVALEGGTAIIGARSDGDTGASYVFSRGPDGRWAQTQKLTPRAGGVFGDFGNSVALEGPTAVIGANLDPLVGDFTGVAYVFGLGSDGLWSEQQRLNAPEPMSEEAFGSAVALDGDALVVGAPGIGGVLGAAHVFTRSEGTWVHTSRLTAKDGVSLGRAVAVAGDGVLVGGDLTGSGGLGGTVKVFSIGFVDDDGSVFEEDIDWLAEAGITRGCNPSTGDQFCPRDVVIRGQMAAFFVRARGLAAPDATAGSDFFVDDDGSLFERDIDLIAANGIARGCNPPDNDRFCPDDPVTRGQMAALLVRAWGIAADGPAVEFVDVAAGTFAQDIAILAATGITRGCNPPANDRFCPDDPVTRGQMAAFIRRAESWRVTP